jgi:hypothetical protein
VRRARTINAAFIALAVVAFATLDFPHGWDRYDIGKFIEWSRAWDNSPRQIYRSSEANYAPIGVVASAGVLSAMRRIIAFRSDDDIVSAFKWYVLVVDAANVVLIWLILSALRIPNASTLALAIYLVPCWSGGAVWGQIDSVAQFFLLISIFALVAIFTGAPSPAAKTWVLAGAIAASVLGVLSKPQFVFSIPALGVGLVAAGRLIVRERGRAAWPLVAVAAGAVLFAVIDRWPELPGGSQHARVSLAGRSWLRRRRQHLRTERVGRRAWRRRLQQLPSRRRDDVFGRPDLSVGSGNRVRAAERSADGDDRGCQLSGGHDKPRFQSVVDRHP